MSYGIQIFNSSGTKTYDTGLDRSSSVVINGTVSITTDTSASATFNYYGDSSSISCPGMTTGNSENFYVYAFGWGNADIRNPSYAEIIRSTNSFVIRFFARNNNYTSNIRYYVLRI